MKLYLVQHGEAVPESQDPSRPLTERGRREASMVAAAAARAGVKVARILHSGKLRAAQTAEVFAEHLKPERGVGRAEGLDPLADPAPWADRLSREGEDLMIVGHLPHLSKLASLLLTGSEEQEPVKFRMAGLLCLEREDGKWRVAWYLTPELAQPA